MKKIDLDKHPNMAILGGLAAIFIPIIGPIFNAFFFKTECWVTEFFNISFSFLTFATHSCLLIVLYNLLKTI